MCLRLILSLALLLVSGEFVLTTRFFQAGAIAAGNTVCLKPSESTTATSALMTELIAEYLDHDVLRVVNGAIPETTKVSRFLDS